VDKVTALIDAIGVIESEIAAKQAELADLKNDLSVLLAEIPERKAFGSNGVGFSLGNAPARREYREEAFELLNEWGLLDRFRSAPRITQKALTDLRKAGALSRADITALDAHCDVIEGELVVRRITDKHFMDDALEVLDTPEPEMITRF